MTKATTPKPATPKASSAKSTAQTTVETSGAEQTPADAKSKRLSTPKAAGAKRNSRARKAKYGVGQVVRHRIYPFRGVVFDIDPVFNNTEEWWTSIPEEIRPRKDQPFYHLLAENAETTYIAYVSEQNLLPDGTGTPVRHPQVKEMFAKAEGGQYRALFLRAH